MLNDTRGGSRRNNLFQSGWIARKLRSASMGPAWLSLGLTFFGAVAKADIVVLKQHNDVYANRVNGSTHSLSNDSLTSWGGYVTNSISIWGQTHTCSAQLNSTISQDSLILFSEATGSFSLLRQGADSQLQFQVSTTRTYNIVGHSLFGTVNLYGSINVLRDGVTWITGPAIGGAFKFETGHTYEIDFAVTGGAYEINLTSVPVALSSLDDRSGTSVKGGTQAAAGVALNEDAPGDVYVTMTSSDTDVAMVPNPVTVTSGTSYVVLAISTRAVKKKTPVTITATYGGVSMSFTLIVTP